MISYYKSFEHKILESDNYTEFDLVSFRFFYCLVLAHRLFVETFSFSNKFEHAAYYIPHSLLFFFGAHEKPDFSFFLLLHYGCIICLILLACGVKSRFTALGAFVTFTWSQLIYYSMHLVPSSKYVWHSRNVIVFILLGFAVISIAPLKRHIWDYLFVKRSRALYVYIVILICFSYSAALFNRAFAMPVDWFSGDFLRNYFFHYGYVTGLELPSRIAQSSWMSFVLSWGTSIFELVCWTLLFSGKHRIIVIFIGIAFHYMIKWSGFADFVDWFGFSYLIFIPYSQIALWLRSCQKRVA